VLFIWRYVGQEKLRPQTGWQPLAFALDWQRPARHMNSTSYLADAAAEDQHVDQTAVVHVEVEPVVETRPDDNHRTPAWAEKITGVSRAHIIRTAREFADNADKTHGRSMIIVGAGLNHWFHLDMNYRGLINMLSANSRAVRMICARETPVIFSAQAGV
jgi:nitrate reductase alpha subunit